MSSSKTCSISCHSGTDAGDFKGEKVTTKAKAPQVSETRSRARKAGPRSPWSDGSRLNTGDEQ